MRYLLLPLFIVHSANAAEVSIHDTSLYLIILFLFLILTSSYAFYVQKATKRDALIKEKDEKIASLQQEQVEHENEYLKQHQEREKEILTLQHTIADLERNIQEGTKSQVVAKIEALEKKRQNSSQV